MQKYSNIIQENITMIDNMCSDLDWLASPNIDEQLVYRLDCCPIECILDCCPDSAIFIAIDKLINEKEIQLILGDTGLDLLRQLITLGRDALRHDNKEGFTKKQPWLDFVDFVNKVNSFLKYSVKRYKAKNFLSKHPRLF